ncbi:putative leucine-rich repeat domain superfamily [Helianthus anomalus]
MTALPTSSDPTISKGMPCSFHNLIEIYIDWTNDITVIPFNVLLQLEKLQKITIKGPCDGIKEVFEGVGSEETNNSGFNASQSAVQIPNLRHVNLEDVPNIKYLWKSNQWMVLEFPNLTTVHISSCNKLEHVFTCSMVGSLVQLQDLHIVKCENIQVIVKEEEESDAKMNEIILPRLKSLKLSKLQSLKGFCLGKDAFSLPTLETLQIEECPAITVFTKGHVSTSELKVIHTYYGIYYVKTNINSTIKTKQEEVPIYILFILKRAHYMKATFIIFF